MRWSWPCSGSIAFILFRACNISRNLPDKEGGEGGREKERKMREERRERESERERERERERETTECNVFSVSNKKLYNSEKCCHGRR